MRRWGTFTVWATLFCITALWLPALASAVGAVMTEFQISSGGNDRHPAISGERVVWVSGPVIAGRDLASKTDFPVASTAFGLWGPSISGSTVVWTDYRTARFDIYGYDLATETEFPISTAAGDQIKPAVSGDTVVWQSGGEGAAGDIYGYDLASKATFPICTATGKQDSPAISGDKVVWEDNRGGGWDIYGYDLTTKSEFVVCTAPGDQLHPAIDGNKVVWTDDRSGKNAIYVYDLAAKSERLICSTAFGLWGPAVSGNTVVWTDVRRGYFDTRGYDLSRSAEFAISLGRQGQPAIDGDTVVWFDSRNADNDGDRIYGATFFWDAKAPTTTATAASVRAGRTVALRFRVNDAPPTCGKAVVKIQIKKRLKVVKTIRLGTKACNAALAYKYRAKLARGVYTWRVLATDVAGNRATTMTAARLTVR